MVKKTVVDYIGGLDEWQSDIVSELRKIILETAPEVEEVMKWAQPVYESNGPIAYIKPFTKSVNLGFWRGIDINDDKGLLQGTGGKMRHVKYDSIDNIDRKALAGFILQAIELNRIKGDPSKNK